MDACSKGRYVAAADTPFAYFSFLLSGALFPPPQDTSVEYYVLCNEAFVEPCCKHDSELLYLHCCMRQISLLYIMQTVVSSAIR